MKKLHDVLAQRKAEILKQWTTLARAEAADLTVSPTELIDHVPKFLDELVALLREADQSAQPPAERSSSAGKHGLQRFRLGFDLDAVVREYGHLHRCIIDAALRDDVSFTQSEHVILIESLYAGIGDAVVQYAAQRDAELRRQGNEHFAFVAHELRSPLTAVQLAWNEILSKGRFPATPLRDVLSRGLKRVKDLIESTLTLAIVSDGVEVQRRHFSLTALVREAVEESSIAAEGRNIRVHVDGPDGWTLYADERMIRSSLTNLIGNAVKFTHEGGAVDIRWREREERIEIEVSDECGGLPPGAAEKMFAPFIQVGQDRSGFGLGLAIANQAIRAHQGTIRVEDRPGQGCTLSIELPRWIRYQP